MITKHCVGGVTCPVAGDSGIMNHIIMRAEIEFVVPPRVPVLDFVCCAFAFL